MRAERNYLPNFISTTVNMELVKRSLAPCTRFSTKSTVKLKCIKLMAFAQCAMASIALKDSILSGGLCKYTGGHL